jgi:aspartate racemase
MPMEGFDETGFSNPESVKQQLINGVKKIENWGADFIVLPCNTVHYFLNDMQAAVSIPILSILNATIETVKNHHHTKIGILSSASTRLLELYKKPFEEHGFETVITSDEEQTAVDSVILTIMAGNHGSKELAVLKTIVQRMSQSGAQAIVLACTELPLALSQKDIDIPLFDTLNILVEHTADEAYKKK